MSPQIRKVVFTMALLTTASGLRAGDLSRYRDFQLGMNLQAAEQLMEVKTTEVKTVHQRPAVIQDLEWRPRDINRLTEPDPLKDVLLSFYNGQLFRIVANYDRYRMEGMTAQDVIDAVSTTYGVAENPAAEILFPSSYSEKVKVIARWENPEYSLNLVRSPYQPSFALVLFSKQLDTVAQAAALEAIRLDAQEAPQREAEQSRRRAEELSAKEEKARMANKPGFRP